MNKMEMSRAGCHRFPFILFILCILSMNESHAQYLLGRSISAKAREERHGRWVA